MWHNDICSGSLCNAGGRNTQVVACHRVEMSLKCEKHVKEAAASLKKALSTPDFNLQVICDAVPSAGLVQAVQRAI